MEIAKEQPFHYPDDMVFGLSNCGIVAMAICAGVSLSEATEWFRVAERVRKNWQGRTHSYNYARFLREKGVWFQQVEYGKDRIRTIGDFAAWHVKPGTMYAIRSAGHMMVCKDGWIGDQHQITPIDGGTFWKRNARLKNHWEIIER